MDKHLLGGNSVNMDAILRQNDDAKNLSSVLFDLLGVKTIPEVVVQYDYPTAYNVNRNIIVIKAPFSLCDFNSIFALAHECFHCFDFGSKQEKETYSANDRKIIELYCDEYAYKYDFEKEATVFACIFVNYFFREIIEYNIGEKIPTISLAAKNKYPELADHERKMISIYIDKKNYYIEIISKFKNELFGMLRVFC